MSTAQDFINAFENESFVLKAMRDLAEPGQRWAFHDVWDNKKLVAKRFEWHEENTQPEPSLESIVAKAQEYKNEWLAKEYQRLRVKEYPSIEEQLDMQYWDSINGTTVWKDTIDAIKNKYPKQL